VPVELNAEGQKLLVVLPPALDLPPTPLAPPAAEGLLSLLPQPIEARHTPTTIHFDSSRLIRINASRGSSKHWQLAS